MRTHLQGTFVLIVVLLVLWGMMRWAGPVIDSALGGEDGAIVARAAVEPADQESEDQLSDQDEPLDGNEVAELQSALVRVGYDPGPVDGIMGDLTRVAADQAKLDLGLVTASDRQLLNTLAAAVEALNTAATEPES